MVHALAQYSGWDYRYNASACETIATCLTCQFTYTMTDRVLTESSKTSIRLLLTSHKCKHTKQGTPFREIPMVTAPPKPPIQSTTLHNRDKIANRIDNANTIPTLSGLWRRLDSQEPVLELALAIRAIRRMVGVVAKDDTLIQWTESYVSYICDTNNDIKQIINLSLNELDSPRQYPVTPKNLDRIIGIAAHEAGHQASGLVDKYNVFTVLKRHIDGAYTYEISNKIHTNWTEIQDLIGIRFFDLITLGEEITADAYVRRGYKVVSKYLDKARLYSRASFPRDSSQFTLENTSLHNLLIADQIYGIDITAPQDKKWKILTNLCAKLMRSSHSNPERQEEYIFTYIILLGMTDLTQILDSQQSQQGDSGKVSDAVQSILDSMTQQSANVPEFKSTLDQMKEQAAEDADTKPDINIPDTPKVNDPNLQLSGSPSPTAFDANHDIEAGPDYSPALPSVRELVDQAMTLANSNMDVIDVSEEVDKQLVVAKSRYRSQGRQKVHITPALTKPEPFTYTPKDRKNAEHIEALAQLRNASLKITQRSRPEGRIDRRRLSRHSISDFIRKQTRTRILEQLDIVLLIDASSSMQDSKIFHDTELIYNTISRKSDVKLHIYSYHDNNLVDIKNITWDKKFHPIHPKGKTPSGEALIAIALQYPEALIIHFTDGEPNRGPAIQDAYNYIINHCPRSLVLNVIQETDRGFKSYQIGSTPRWDSVKIENEDGWAKEVMRKLEEWAKEGLY